MAEQVKVASLPDCNFCDEKAQYDFATYSGSWANGCERHFKLFSATKKLGTGMGQRLVLAESTTDSESKEGKSWDMDDAPDFDTLEEWLMDGICETPDGCQVEPDGRCPHGQPSWALILGFV